MNKTKVRRRSKPAQLDYEAGKRVLEQYRAERGEHVKTLEGVADHLGRMGKSLRETSSLVEGLDLPEDEREALATRLADLGADFAEMERKMVESGLCPMCGAFLIEG